ncbi:MAG: hypothetical protein A3A80_03495 [Candidatus Terrybacteria bacterium RIFCSPLOWO2_01_FULL_44_24]|uniref:Uncharacterized protein n=1 Tax=Candidatus Terrybacteria bacterium RIFCSPHIGHO2_01_FULL_43_35 TaxID=1802361 RepID=A0A1G2PDH9_9BACT|nr:MAG: hypothetical protein A2828_00415 [Candidatus Terrybacteria bacterium RIFCSPHIGHO2_01_FULL_43_35]OHA49749.1 MAG: hypothetical protein A3B75_01990 [Candidatus Terrybacteria bacterium RIFCSPHIGHO2_02_FULL_43_14]OHA51571.1 MAG: hypothetical protein A3A80_03495 [Candidatus Terrybacteria bacterium RIFCSPLOWO2_01_FULL_44_24]
MSDQIRKNRGNRQTTNKRVGAAARQAKGDTRRLVMNRAERADTRQEVRATRSPQEQLVLLDKRPGKAAKERARLRKKIAAFKRIKSA